MGFCIHEGIKPFVVECCSKESRGNMQGLGISREVMEEFLQVKLKWLYVPTEQAWNSDKCPMEREVT